MALALRRIAARSKILHQTFQCLSSHQSHYSCLDNSVICSLVNRFLLPTQISFNNQTVRRLHSGRNSSAANDLNQDYNKKERLSVNNFRRDRQECVELFRNILHENNDKQWSSDDWLELGEQLSKQFSGSWEVLCMHTLMIDSNIEIGRSLMKYLETRNEAVGGPVITTFYIGLLGKTCNGNEKQESELKKYYDDLVSVTDVFDAASIEVLVEGLSYTKHYKECVKLLEICKLTSPPGFSLLRNVLMGALRYSDNELLSFALDYFESNLEPSQLVMYANTLIGIAISSKNQQGLNTFMEFMRKHSIYLSQPQLEDVVETFQRNEPGQWNGSFGFANFKSGKCTVCGHQLPRIEISDEDFNDIQSAFLQQVIISDNIFYKTSPQEIKNFIKYVENFGPFDVVIDGMNALHVASPRKPSKQMLERLVHYYCDQGKQVLVLGSKVLRQFVQKLGSFSPRPAVYMTSTTRADDAFFLYAALHSGKDTKIVSADKLRDHKFRMQPELRHVFHKWLTSIQIYSFVNPKTGIINPKRHTFDLGPEKDEHGWHMPVNDADMKRSFGRQAVLCLRHGPENFPLEKPNKRRDDNAANQEFNPNKEWFEL